ncbi:hypothetical protein [Salinifilum ghardaiensis]
MHTSPRHTPAGDTARGAGHRQPVFLPLTVQVARSAATAEPKRAEAPRRAAPAGAAGAPSPGARGGPRGAQGSGSQGPGAQGSGARGSAQEVRRCAEAAEFTADGCWNALRGGCRSAERALLPARLDDLVQAASDYVDPRWWYGRGSPHRRKVAEAQQRIDEAVHEGDGAEFAEAFVGYDQALATAMVSARTTVESSTR